MNVHHLNNTQQLMNARDIINTHQLMKMNAHYLMTAQPGIVFIGTAHNQFDYNNHLAERNRFSCIKIICSNVKGWLFVLWSQGNAVKYTFRKQRVCAIRTIWRESQRAFFSLSVQSSHTISCDGRFPNSVNLSRLISWIWLIWQKLQYVNQSPLEDSSELYWLWDIFTTFHTCNQTHF